MRVELKQLQRRTGITFVYVTHDQGEALALSDQIAVMHGGRLQQYGTPEDVYRRPANKIVADFMGIVNFLPCEVRTTRDGTRLGAGIADVDLPVDISPGTGAGAPIQVAVRPEDIRLHRARGKGEALPGTVRERTFLGNITEYWVEIAEGTTLRVQTHPGEKFEVGDAVFAEIDARECSVFPGK
jgi:ABC-type Fe3+/spermidine/putrescine transport system ATPase subunit